MATLVIIDDDPIVIESIKMITENSGYTISGTGNSGEEAIRLYQETLPDLILMDIRMEGGSGIEATREILARYSDAKVLLVTTFEDDEFIRSALSFGARGYILKQNIQSLLPAIEAVLSGNTVLDEKIIKNVQNIFTSANTNDTEMELTDREAEIYQAIAEGLNNKEIADQLFLSEGTVRNYVSLLLEKFDVRDRTQLAITYYKNK